MAVFRSPFDEVTPRPYRDRRFAAVHEQPTLRHAV
jgi:hypothetical protein